MKKRLVWIFAWLMLCASAVMSAPFSDKSLNITFPERIGNFDFRGQVEYPSPGLGYSLRYDDKQQFKVDIYVYDNDVPNIEEGIVSKLVTDEFKAVTDTILYMEKLGKYKEVKPLNNGTKVFLNDKLPFLWARFEYQEITGEPTGFILRVSETYFAAVAGKFVKVRLTLPAEDFKNKQQDIEVFMEQLAKTLASAKKTAKRI